MLIVGGLDAWKKELGRDEVVRGGLSSSTSESQKVTAAHSSSPSSTGSFNTTLASEPHKLWTPHSKGNLSIGSSDKGTSSQNEDHSQSSLDHTPGVLQFVQLLYIRDFFN